MRVNVPGSGTRVVYGVTDYGVLQKGDAKPFKLTYYPKAVIGTATAKEATVGEKLPLEVVATGGAGKVKFQVLTAGKPLADSEVTVMLPDGAKKAVKTDKDGLHAGVRRGGPLRCVREADRGEAGRARGQEVRRGPPLRDAGVRHWEVSREKWAEEE